MNNYLKKFKIVLVVVSFIFVLTNNIYAEVYYPPNYNYSYPNYNQINPYNQVNPYMPPNGIYGYSIEGTFLIPHDAYYYMIGYDRNAYIFSGGEVMQSRVPVLAGNYPYPTQIANKLIYSAYLSISNWCNDNIYTSDSIQDYYLNNAYILSAKPTEVVLIVNCAIKKKGIIGDNEEFRVIVNIQNGRFIWRKLSNRKKSSNGDNRVYEFDSGTGKIIIIE